MALVKLENIRILCEASGEFLEVDPRDLMAPRDKGGYTIIRVEKFGIPIPGEEMAENLRDAMGEIESAESNIYSARKALKVVVAAFEKGTGLRV